MSPLRRPDATRGLAAIVLLALLLGQWTLLAHSIAHARAPAAAALSADADGDWSHRAGSPACHLVDHLLTGQAPGAEAAPDPTLPSAAMRVAAPPSSIGPAAAARAYEARGPPRA